MSFRRNRGKGRGNFRNRGGGGKNGNNKRGWSGFKKNKNRHSSYATNDDLTSDQWRKNRLKERIEKKTKIDLQDSEFGFERFESRSANKVGWLLNMNPTIATHPDSGDEQSAVDFYFLTDDGDTFKATSVFHPYFYVYCDESLLHSMEQFLMHKFERFLYRVEIAELVDLDQKNHLTGLRRKYLKLIFLNGNDLWAVSRQLRTAVEKNAAQKATQETYGGGLEATNKKGPHSSGAGGAQSDLLREIVDIREYDVPYICRLCIDLNIRIGKWYDVIPQPHGLVKLRDSDAYDLPAEARVLAFDIETCKTPLKFPNADTDEIMMISYMIDNEGYLIVNRSVVADDIDDFEYTPKPEYEGHFTVFNEMDEIGLLRRFFEHIRDSRPHIYVTYNGDFFDWPYIETRAQIHNLDMLTEIGIWPTNDIYGGRFAVHMDCFCWVQRDSYLPQGSQGLKAVTKYKLGYNPVELDPELMTPYAQEKPAELATYSVSDAVATYYLFKNYVQSFTFSLCQIIPLNSGDVLRKGSGTLCEALLMVQAFEKRIVAPNKQVDHSLKFFKGQHLLESETYIGGHVQCFESGCFRHDIPIKFAIEPDAIDELINEVDRTLQFAIAVEGGMRVDEMTNYEQVKADIIAQLTVLRDNPRMEIVPLIYHLDVAAMYPNIILTNRLQPCAVVDNETCAACDFNRVGSNCQRQMDWRWRGKYFPATRGEYKTIRNQMEMEMEMETKQDTDERARNEMISSRVKDYCQKVYRKATIEIEEERSSVICQRENGFYVDTVQAFRDRRYEYKGKTKFWKKKMEKCSAENAVQKKECEKMVTLYDSLQLAHKCILNSFYGYVMRRGARWYSMDMAAITTHVGGQVIKEAHLLVERIGRPLELDTDGIWACLPGNFPEKFYLSTNNEKRPQLEVEYPCSMLNVRTHDKFTNHQHQTLTGDTRLTYDTRSECSIFFEVDGPYRAMVLPASTEEGRKLKKRYAVFNMDGSLAELKGFEIKRRGELQMIKIFQENVFKRFLMGHTLEDVYKYVADASRKWLDILDTRAKELSDDELLSLITESKNMSKTVEEYGVGARSTAITCAKRLASFLGESMIKDSGLNCKFVISHKPVATSVSDRAVPVAIFQAEPPIMKQYLKRWLADSSITDFDIRSILDWDYYRRRIGSNIQKIVTIPAAMQGIANPLPQLAHPQWLEKTLREQSDPYQQRKITSFFGQKAALSEEEKKEEARQSRAMDIDSEQKDESREKANETGKQPQSAVVTAAESSVEAVTEEMEPTANLVDDFPTWLTQSKRLWNTQRIERKRTRRKRKRNNPNGSNPSNKRRRGNSSIPYLIQSNVSEDDDDDIGGNNIDGGVSRYIQKRLDELYQSTWQIVQIVALDTPGKFLIWAFTDDAQLRSIKLHVKRCLYLNLIDTESFPSLLQREETNYGSVVNRVLPRSRQCYNLIRMRIDESEFEARSKEVGMFMAHQHVEGVYETNVPLLFRVVSALGCCCAVQRGSKMKLEHTTAGFDLDELCFRFVAEQPYLEHESPFLVSAASESSRIKYVYLFHSRADKNERSIFGLFVQSKKARNVYHCSIVVVTPSNYARLENPNLNQYTQTKVESLLEIDPNYSHVFGPNLQLKIETNRVKTVADGYRKVAQLLETFRSGMIGNSIVLSQSCVELNDLYHRIPVLRESFPVISFPFDDEYNNYPALQWYTHATRQMVDSLLQLPMRLENYKQIARYGHIPVGNIPMDVLTHVTDVFYSRLLLDNNHVLWVSNGSRPDLGGLEEDDNLFEDEHANPCVNKEGAYFSVCVEITLKHLAVNTVIQSDFIQSLHEITTTTDDSANNASVDDDIDNSSATHIKSNLHIDDASSCAAAFTILKKMIQNLLIRGIQDDASLAHPLLRGFYRWLRSPASKLYDPLLHRMVHRMMKKVFYRLIAQFEKMGANVIHATFSSILIETGKNDACNASAYVAHCLETIHKNELFKYISLLPTHTWNGLMWFDHANYGGFLLHPKADLENLSPNEQLNIDNYDRELESQWNIASFLPRLAQDCFEAMIAEYIETCCAQRDKLTHEMANEASEELKTNFIQFRTELVEIHLANKLFGHVTELHRRLRPDTSSADKSAAHFPNRPGSHLPLQIPALEYVKTVCRVLTLDNECRDTVTALRRNLMKFVHIGDFSNAAAFENPCLTYVLCDVNCDFCKETRDIDLCRHQFTNPKSVIQLSDDDGAESDDSTIRCENCSKAYCRDLIESMLLEVVRRRETSYHVQDVNCVACHRPKADHMSEYCHCSSQYRTNVSRQQFQQSMTVFLRIAEYFAFDFLHDTVTWILNASY